ncbi:MAG: hypothetical protein R3B06_11620 [Kofleriaceae bacterium]
MRLAVAAVTLAALAACQSGTAPPGGAPAPGAPQNANAAAGPPVMATLSKAEADSLCNAFERSGAAADEEANHGYLIANWLAKEIVSDTGRAWLVGFAQLGGDKPARRAALAQAAQAAGLADCPLIAMWQ